MSTHTRTSHYGIVYNTRYPRAGARSRSGWVISAVALLGVLALVSQVTGGGW